MKRFEDMNPIAVGLYYLCVLALTMFSMQPVFLCISLISAVINCAADRSATKRSHIFTAAIFFIAALLNPLIVHNGVTVLFYINDNPFTLEALIYGIAATAMIAAALYWLRSLSRAMTSDKIMYIFGRLSPKTALIISMSIRYVELFRQRWKKIRDAQTALGLYDDGNLIDSVKGSARVLSILITWTLENGIVTAESMEARGCGSGRRRSFAVCRIHVHDVILMVLCAALTALSAAGIYYSKAVYYPSIELKSFTIWGTAGAAAFAVLCLLPVMINVKEAVRWRLLISKV